MGEFVWNNRLTIIPGVRIDFGDRKAVGVPASAGAAETEDTARSYTLAAMYDLSESLPVFGTLASTRRMPTLDELYSYRPQVASLTLRKEAARTGELGLAWALQQSALEGLRVNLTVENVFDADCRNNLALDKSPGMNVKLAIGKSLRWRGWHSFCWSSWPRQPWPRGPRQGDLDAAERLPDHHRVRPWRQVFPEVICT